MNLLKIGILAAASFTYAADVEAQNSTPNYAGGDSGVGEVIVSILKPTDFESIYGPDWALLDGQNVSSKPISGFLPSKLRTTGPTGVVTNLPDARGRFLRMPNHGVTGDDRDTDGDRHIGNVQSDNIESHGHSYQGITIKGGHSRAGRAGNNRWSGLRRDEYAQLTSVEVGGEETRPSNITINYYVRVACTTGGKCSP